MTTGGRAETFRGPEVPWWVPQMTGNELEGIRGALTRNFINEGEMTSQFEREIARLVGARHAVAVTSGTAALFLALAGAGVGPGDEVIVPDATFIATANAVRLAGATPVLADIDPARLTLAPGAFEAAITPRTRAVMPVHVSGRAADMTAIAEIARSRRLVVVEDAAEAFMSASCGKFLGTIGRAGCLSFSPHKVITTGQGGMVLTDDDALHARLRELKDQGRPVRGTGGDDLHPSLGYNFKFTDLQAAVGLAQLSALEARLARQRQLYRIYARRLTVVGGLELPGFDLAGGECPLWTDVLLDRRDALDGFLAEQGMHCRRFWLPLHTQAPYRRPDVGFPGAARALRRALWLPSAFTLTDGDAERVASAVLAFTGAA